jgi:hypothetical protein
MFGTLKGSAFPSFKTERAGPAVLFFSTLDRGKQSVKIKAVFPHPRKEAPRSFRTYLLLSPHGGERGRLPPIRDKARFNSFAARKLLPLIFL